MKKCIFIVATLITLNACNHTEVDKLKFSNDSLTSVINERDTSLSNFITSFTEVENNLDSVAARQQIISINTKPNIEYRGSVKIRINDQIKAINDLMEKNRKELIKLNKRLKNSTYKNNLLEKTIAALTIQLAQKEYELGELNLKLNALNVKVAKLNTTVDSLLTQNYIKSIFINYQTAQMNKAYYIIGESKTLRDEKIIDRKGGVLGIGRTSELNQDIDNSKFTEIDFTKITVIPVNGKVVKIVTNHPTDSYSLEKEVEGKSRIKNIIISNPAGFWSTSKYLVIVKK
jgi:uncharacterized coiled-coil protein SlyX